MPPGDTAAATAVGAQSRAERLNTRAAGVVGFAVLCSRVLGLAREQIFAALFGGGRDIYRLPIFLRLSPILFALLGDNGRSPPGRTVFSHSAVVFGFVLGFVLCSKVFLLFLVFPD